MTRDTIVLAFASGLVALAACSHDTIEFGHLPPISDGPGFSDADAATAPPSQIAYCPSTRCTNNTATCAGSLFPCDVDLSSDDANCGACGVSCAGATGIGLLQCQNGKCELDCDEGTADCNGILEDGCETHLHTNANCNACGDSCSDPGKPCVIKAIDLYQCGCSKGETFCTNRCVNSDVDDANCGGCGVQCDPTNGGATAAPHTYFGCFGATCGQSKCESGFIDCDKDPATGCETASTTEENCGGCGVACAPGQKCRDVQGVPTCLCAPGETYCGGKCTDLATDVANCGACGVDCYGSLHSSAGAHSGYGHGIGYCTYGSCSFECAHGWGECNGDPGDNCETNLNSDPTNCGGCGIRCLDDQPCIGGACAVEPCADPGATN